MTDPVTLPREVENIVHVEVSGLTGTGKSAIMGEIEIALRALGIEVRHGPDFQAEKNGTHADWQAALDLYRPTVVLAERNVPHTPAPAGEGEKLREGVMAAIREHVDAVPPGAPDGWLDGADEAADAIIALISQREARAREALEPFAALAGKFPCWSMVEVCAPDPDNPSPVIQPIPLSAFEAAAAVLKAIHHGNEAVRRSKPKNINPALSANERSR